LPSKPQGNLGPAVRRQNASAVGAARLRCEHTGHMGAVPTKKAISGRRIKRCEGHHFPRERQKPPVTLHIFLDSGGKWDYSLVKSGIKWDEGGSGGRKSHEAALRGIWRQCNACPLRDGAARDGKASQIRRDRSRVGPARRPRRHGGEGPCFGETSNM
jgi:hypothetical protein